MIKGTVVINWKENGYDESSYVYDYTGVDPLVGDIFRVGTHKYVKVSSRVINGIPDRNETHPNQVELNCELI